MDSSPLHTEQAPALVPAAQLSRQDRREMQRVLTLSTAILFCVPIFNTALIAWVVGRWLRKYHRSLARRELRNCGLGNESASKSDADTGLFLWRVRMHLIGLLFGLYLTSFVGRVVGNLGHAFEMHASVLWTLWFLSDAAEFVLQAVLVCSVIHRLEGERQRLLVARRESSP